MQQGEVVKVSVLEHRKAPNFVQDYADRVNILVNDSGNSGRVLSIIFGRDAAEIREEQAATAADGKSHLAPTKIEAYRYDLAHISMPAEAARQLADAILGALAAQRPDGA